MVVQNTTKKHKNIKKKKSRQKKNKNNLKVIRNCLDMHAD